MPMNVNYVVESFKAPVFSHPDTPKLRILSKNEGKIDEKNIVSYSELR